VGLQQRDYISCGFDNTDLVIAIGYDLIEYSKSGIPMEDSDYSYWITPAEIDSSYIPMVEVVGDISDSLNEILKRSDRQGKPEPYALELRADIQADYEQYAKDDAFPIKPQKLIYDLRQVMGPEDIVISDGGAQNGLRGIIIAIAPIPA